MNHAHPDIANKNFEYIQLDESFHHFAADECLCYDAETLLSELEETVLARHGQAIALQVQDHPRTIWRLENDDLMFTYQVLVDVVEVGGIRSKRTNAIYEPKHDLFAEFSR